MFQLGDGAQPQPGSSALLAALHAGHFYSSQGPEFLEVAPLPGGTKLAVRTSPVRTLHLTGRGASNSTVAADSDFTTAELDLGSIKGPFARLTAIDHRVAALGPIRSASEKPVGMEHRWLFPPDPEDTSGLRDRCPRIAGC